MLANNIQKTVDAIYPVGALYLSMNATNPEQLFGGSWKQLTADAYLKIVTSGASENAQGQTDHKIPISSMPSHTHIQNAHAHKFNIANQNEWSGNVISGHDYNARYPGFVEQSGGGGDNYQYTSGHGTYLANYETATNQNTGGGGHTIRAISVFMSGIAPLKSLLQGGAVC